MKVKFITFGCKVNQYESQALMEEVSLCGHEVTDSLDADIFIINTCSVTRKADSKAREIILRLKRRNPQARLVASGCLAQHDKVFFEKLGVDQVVAQQDKHLLVKKVFSQAEPGKDIWSLKISSFSNIRAFLKIQDGCDNCCSFCKIPYIRGRSISRPRQDVIDEVARLGLKHKEIILCGVNLGLYGKDLKLKTDLASLVKEILNIKSLYRLRLSSLEPCLVDDKLLEFYKDPRICGHLHFPFQSGDDKVLAAMNKKETVGLYESISAKARDINPDIAISCDIMVGFPTEDKESFENTIAFLKRVKPMRLHIFTFSPRPRTRLENVKIKDPRLAKQRHDILDELGKELAKEYADRFKGKILEVIAEEKSGQFVIGYTQNYLKVKVKGNVESGAICRVKIDSAVKGQEEIQGELVS